MTTLAQYRTRIAAKIGSDTTAAGLDETLIDAWVNEGVTDFLLRTRCKVESGTTTLAAGEDDFTIDTDIMLIQDCYLTGTTQNYPMTPVTVHELLAMRQSLVNTAIGPIYYAVAGANLFMVHPSPTAAITILIYYVPRPATLSSAGSSPDEIPAEFHKAVEFYALAEMADYDDDASSAQGERYRQEYEKWVTKARNRILVKGNARLPRARAGRGRERYARREDVY